LNPIAITMLAITALPRLTRLRTSTSSSATMPTEAPAAAAVKIPYTSARATTRRMSSSR